MVVFTPESLVRRFEKRGKLDDLGLEIDTNTQKSTVNGSSKYPLG
jgi:hypothetical protein